VTSDYLVPSRKVSSLKEISVFLYQLTLLNGICL